MSSVFAMQESWLEMQDKTPLFLRQWRSEGRSRANVLLVHGMGEHSSRYLHVAERLARHRLSACLFDLRGHGRSGGLRGDIDRYSQLIDDIARVWEKFASDGRPIFLYGHSMGGQLAINFTIQRAPQAQGVIGASPWFDLAFRPRAWKLWLAAVAMRVWPRFTQQTDVAPTRLSRDQEFLASLPDLQLVHHRMSARMYAGLCSGAEMARESATKFSRPLLLLHGESDPVTSVAATQTFFDRAASSDKKLSLYPDGLHETHNDLDREKVIRDVIQWIEERCP